MITPFGAGVLEIDPPCEGEIEATLENGVVTITGISWYGEGSGSRSEELEALLRASHGRFDAAVVWESGDVEYWKCQDGVLTIESVDILALVMAKEAADVQS